jgi:hypothetical protein
VDEDKDTKKFPSIKLNLPKIKTEKGKSLGLTSLLVIVFVITGSYLYISNIKNNLGSEKKSTEELLNQTKKELEDLKNQDQVKINTELKTEIDNINSSYNKAVSLYEDMLDLKLKVKDTSTLDEEFANSLSLLGERKYDQAQDSLKKLEDNIAQENEKLVEKEVAQVTTQDVPTNNNPPGSGYSRQQVSTDAGTFTVSIVAADYGSTKVIVDTASGSDCSNNCPVLPLATYVSRNAAYAGVNGSYFCPATYPSCAGKTNTFDTLLMNKDKTYFNSDNNVYSNNPAVIFGGGYIRFVSATSQWGRDTSIDSMLSNYPLLVSGGNVVFGGDDDPKKGSKGNRSFVANRGNTIYIGVVHSATVAESARVMKALEMDNAMNLDDGGSTALWHGGYKVGPGRDLPNVILFVSK